jgi:Uncharacterised protein family (UPF0158)
MRRLKIDLQELAMFFDEHGASSMHRAYLDLETGQVIPIDDHSLDEFEGEDEEPLDEGPEGADLPDGADWLQEARADYQEVVAGLGTRYIEVPSDDTTEAYRDMEEFIATVEEGGLRHGLERAISGRGAFRRFKEILSQSFQERERWFRFRDARVEERLRAWLASKDIELIEEPGEREAKERRYIEDLARTRQDLIAFVLATVREMRGLPGVLRIALIGSLTTDRPIPKDADLLVTVSDDADLSSLATLARRLQGRAQQLNRGADVFLLDGNARYLGRTCPWRDCRPGVRQSCDALHCGRRHFLHDDLQVITLANDVTAAPAIELWPQIKARVPVPEDIKVGLLEVL